MQEAKHKPSVVHVDCSLYLLLLRLATEVEGGEHIQPPRARTTLRPRFLNLKKNMKFIKDDLLLREGEGNNKDVEIPCFVESEMYPLFLPAIIQFSGLTLTSYNTSSCHGKEIAI